MCLLRTRGFAIPSLALGLALLCACATERSVERLDKDELSGIIDDKDCQRLENDGKDAEFPEWTNVYCERLSSGVCMKDIAMGKGLKLRASFGISSHGNGTLEIANLNLRKADDGTWPPNWLHVYDGCDDGAVYKDKMLDVDFVDVDGDGYKDIVVSGEVYYSDGVNSIVCRREPVAFIYLFDPSKKAFFRAYRNASFALEDGPDGANALDYEGKFLVEGRKASLANNASCKGKPRECVSIVSEDFTRDGMNVDSNEKAIAIGQNVELNAILKKRDGILKIANLSLPVYGARGQAFYNDDILTVDFLDLNSDGYKDLAVSGLVCYPNDSDGMALMTEPVLFVYMFDAKSKTFKLAYRDASFKLEDGPCAGRKLGAPAIIDQSIKEGRHERE